MQMYTDILIFQQNSAVYVPIRKTRKHKSEDFGIKMASIQTCLGMLLCLSFICKHCQAENKLALIPIGSHNVAGKLGSHVELPCTKPADDDIEWLLPTGEPASRNSSEDRVTQIGSLLKIGSVWWNDTGNYTCRLVKGAANDTLVFKVYETPTYFLEGIVILSINSALLILFFVCLIVTFIQTKRKRKLEKFRKEKLHKSLEAYS